MPKIAGEEKHVLTTKIPGSLIKELRYLSVDAHMPMNGLIEEAVRDLLEKYRKGRVGTPQPAEAQGQGHTEGETLGVLGLTKQDVRELVAEVFSAIREEKKKENEERLKNLSSDGTLKREVLGQRSD